MNTIRTTTAASTTRPAKRSGKRRTSTERRRFGSIRRERSGRYSAHYTDPTTGARVSAPDTFDTERTAEDWLTTIKADIVRGVHKPATFGAIPLADYFADWLDHHTGLSPNTREQYAEHLRRWIDRELTARPSTGRTNRAARPIRLGSHHLSALTPATIREWFAAATYTQHAERAERHALALHKSDRRHPARIWAESVGVPCSTTGRLSPVVLAAWQRAGSPEPIPPRALVPTDPKPATVIRQAYRTLRACLSDAVRDGLIDANPCQIPGAGSGKAAERRPATVAEVETIAAAMPDRFAAAVLVAAWSGLRAGELFALARAHVDLDAGTVRVERAMKIPRDGVPYIGPTKTDASRRVVHLPAHVTEALREHMATFTGTSPDALVFAREDGTLVPAWQRRAMFHRARAVAGRPDLRWHDLRHTGATLAARAGASIRELQHRLGHTTYAAAMNYQHTSTEQDRDVAARLDSIAAGLRSPNVRSLSDHRNATATEVTA